MKVTATFQGENGVLELKGERLLFNGKQIGTVDWSRDTERYAATVGTKLAIHEQRDQALEEVFRRAGIAIDSPLPG